MIIKNINLEYHKMMLTIKQKGDYMVTRGAGVWSLFGYNMIVDNCPIVTLRRTAWKTALKELEWFMSGKESCPEGVLRDVWWKGQLSPEDKLKSGYPSQLRRSVCNDGIFDQIIWLREEIKKHPSSRRLCLTVWNPGTMAFFPEINENPMTPTSCHLIWNQFQVRNNLLHMNAVFRSTDAILGLPHNLVQHRALQLYFAHHAGIKAAPFFNLYLNDVHFYDHPEHKDFALWLENFNADAFSFEKNSLIYQPTSIDFKASDFVLENELSGPLYTNKITRTL